MTEKEKSIKFVEWMNEKGYRRVEYTYPKEIRYRNTSSSLGEFLSEVYDKFIQELIIEE